MKIIYLKRGKGKTTKMIEWLLENPIDRFLLVIHDHERERISNSIKLNYEPQHSCPSASVMTFEQFFKYETFSPALEIGIDNVDYFIFKFFQRKFGVNVKIVSLSQDNNL